MSTTYPIRPGESIWDVTFNATGTLSNTTPMDNLDAILEANDIDDWTPDLPPGQRILIPDTVLPDINALKGLQAFPLCNFCTSGIEAKIKTIFDILENNWILSTGFWNDRAIWIDTKTWID